MKAKLMLKERYILSENSFVEIVVWSLTVPLKGRHHDFKYRLAFVVDGKCVLRYDNEAGKGDHKHIADDEIPYVFKTIQTLIQDFWDDVDNWRI